VVVACVVVVAGGASDPVTLAVVLEFEEPHDASISATTAAAMTPAADFAGPRDGRWRPRRARGLLDRRTRAAYGRAEAGGAFLCGCEVLSTARLGAVG